MVVWLDGPAHLDFAPGWRTIGFALAIEKLAYIFFGLSPARQASSPPRHRSRMHTLFMAAQITASCVLLALSALLVRALDRAANLDPGFDYAHIITVDPQLYAHGYTPSRAVAYMQDLRSRLEQLPGVETSALTLVVPL